MAKARVVNIQFNDEPIAFPSYTNRLLAEGDSWFAWAHLNLKPSSNIVEQLEFRDPTVIVNLAYSGDVIHNMSDARANLHFCFELQALRYDAILLSGGGNDLIDALSPGDGRPAIIVPSNGDPGEAKSYVDAVALDALTSNVQAGYARLIAMRDDSDANKQTPIVLHTYDFPTPRNAKATFLNHAVEGPWLLPAMKKAHVPAALYVDVTDITFKALANALFQLNDPANGVHVVKTHGTLERADLNEPGLSGDWINEIHPDAYGYALLAQKISGELANLGIH